MILFISQNLIFNFGVRSQLSSVCRAFVCNVCSVTPASVPSQYLRSNPLITHAACMLVCVCSGSSLGLTSYLFIKDIVAHSGINTQIVPLRQQGHNSLEVLVREHSSMHPGGIQVNGVPLNPAFKYFK